MGCSDKEVFYKNDCFRGFGTWFNPVERKGHSVTLEGERILLDEDCPNFNCDRCRYRHGNCRRFDFDLVDMYKPYFSCEKHFGVMCKDINPPDYDKCNYEKWFQQEFEFEQIWPYWYHDWGCNIKYVKYTLDKSQSMYFVKLEKHLNGTALLVDGDAIRLDAMLHIYNSGRKKVYEECTEPVFVCRVDAPESLQLRKIIRWNEKHRNGAEYVYNQTLRTKSDKNPLESGVQ